MGRSGFHVDDLCADDCLKIGFAFAGSIARQDILHRARVEQFACGNCPIVPQAGFNQHRDPSCWIIHSGQDGVVALPLREGDRKIGDPGMACGVLRIDDGAR